MMAGEQISPEAHRIEPLGIATRQSTDTLAIDDPNIAATVRFIREHACDGINVDDVQHIGAEPVIEPGMRLEP